MIVKYFTNNLDCLCYIKLNNSKYYYVDDTKGYSYEITKEEVERI